MSDVAMLSEEKIKRRKKEEPQPTPRLSSKSMILLMLLAMRRLALIKKVTRLTLRNI